MDKLKRVYIKTFGCQMNERDSEIIYSLMIRKGYVPAQSYEDADIIIFNTCAVRKHAEDRVWGKLSELKRLKVKESSKCPANKAGLAQDMPDRDIIIGLAGCMGKAYGKDVFKRLEHVDFVCGPSNIYDIPALVEKVSSGKRHICSVSKESRPLDREKGLKGSAESLYLYRENNVSSFVNISYGCNNFCSYCIVPYVRGREVSRPRGCVIEEIKYLVDRGIKEVTLLGQNVNSYKSSGRALLGGKNDFVKLLQSVNRISGLERIRFMTSHPKDANLELFKAIAGLDKVCQHLHLPLQSGSDRILKLMNRGYSSKHYQKLVDDMRKIAPECAITTDIIVGFPSETEEDFGHTRDIMDRIGFDGAFIFKYSPRPFAESFKMQDDVSEDAKRRRNQDLLNLQARKMRENIVGFIGNVESVLGLSPAKRPPDSLACAQDYYIKARTMKNYQIVCKADKSLIGKIFDVKITGVQDNTLVGNIV
ncbi:MAG: tRNA (N6-isopentenyl adenosine(37)-C2)-methylthiotransferase MiaB [Candidatus Omnitrophica bacterium]|nr:tRNA (N6-isopentenyl adenosine(37)-C2)-methylthiotransferase MiaB [Candidatus Omnitrophota bacterium]